VYPQRSAKLSWRAPPCVALFFRIWRKRFAQLRVPGLEDEPRSGRRVINNESVERRILDQLAKAPPPGFARWNGRLVAEALGDVSDDAVWRVMRKHDLHWIGARVSA
jgi:hypothetical protein